MIPCALDPGMAQVRIADYSVGEEAAAFRLAYEVVTQADTRVFSQARFREAWIESLREAMDEAREEGWDGYRGQPARARAIIEALRFLEYIPLGTPLPEIAVDSEGDVALDWSPEKGRVVTIRIPGDGEIYYAGLDRGARFYGRELLREGLPKSVWQAIERVVSRPGV